MIVALVIAGVVVWLALLAFALYLGRRIARRRGR